MNQEASRVLVVGGATGIGAAVVRNLLADGYRVDFTYAASSDSAQRLCDDSTGLACAIQADLSDEQGAVELCSLLSSREIPYYGLIYCAGVASDQLAQFDQWDRVRRAFEVNFWSFVRIAGLLLPVMRRRRNGRIVAITSVAAARGSRGNGIYASSKAALEAYCRCLVNESARKGITVNCVAPGFVDTDMVRSYVGLDETIAAQVPAARLGRPEEVAALVNYLLSAEAGYTTGATMVIDGGLVSTLHSIGAQHGRQ